MPPVTDFFRFPEEKVSPLHYLEVDEAIRYEDEKFTECRAVKLFYVIYGRNAWNDTWITRYFDGCMNPSMDTAKKTAEQKRVQGSVFYIIEIPALQFISSRFSVLVTEINTPQPLQYCKEFQDNVPVSAKSIFDHFAPPKENSITRLIWKKSSINRTTEDLKGLSCNLCNFEILKAPCTFKKLKSFSHGKEYLLGWNEVDHRMSQSAVVRLAAQFDSMIVKQRFAEYKATCDEMVEIYKIPVAELKLSDTAINTVMNAGFRFVGDFACLTENRLENAVSDTKNVIEIKDVLAEMGIALKPKKAAIEGVYREKSIEKLKLSVRTETNLKKADISTIGQLVELCEADLLRKQNMGRRSVNEIKDVLSDVGLSLA